MAKTLKPKDCTHFRQNYEKGDPQTMTRGYYQICQALKETGVAVAELAALKSAHDALRTKPLPKVYEYGFLNPDAEEFK